MFRQDLFVLYVVCTIFAEDGVRFGDFCVQVCTITLAVSLTSWSLDRMRFGKPGQVPVFSRLSLSLASFWMLWLRSNANKIAFALGLFVSLTSS